MGTRKEACFRSQRVQRKAIALDSCRLDNCEQLDYSHRALKSMAWVLEHLVGGKHWTPAFAREGWVLSKSELKPLCPNYTLGYSKAPLLVGCLCNSNQTSKSSREGSDTNATPMSRNLCVGEFPYSSKGRLGSIQTPRIWFKWARQVAHLWFIGLWTTAAQKAQWQCSSSEDDAHVPPRGNLWELHTKLSGAEGKQFSSASGVKHLKAQQGAWNGDLRTETPLRSPPPTELCIAPPSHILRETQKVAQQKLSKFYSRLQQCTEI